MQGATNPVALPARQPVFLELPRGPGRATSSWTAPPSPSTTLQLRLRRPPPQQRLGRLTATMGRAILSVLVGPHGIHAQGIRTLPAAPQTTMPLPCTEFKGGTSRLGRRAAFRKAP